MRKSTSEVEQDIYDVVSVFLKDIIDGGVYKEGCRPTDSKEEDAVIAISFGSATQIQDFGAYINIYVSDVKMKGRYVPNKNRLTELGSVDELLLEALNQAYYYEYNFDLDRATQTYQEREINQHRVSINLSVKRKTF